MPELAWHLEDGVQVYDAPDHPGQWWSVLLRCPACKVEWWAAVPIPSYGAECPHCGYVDEEAYFDGNEPEPVIERTWLQ